jgi:3-oxo-5-alpha-steroid 4-dehydrogenase 1
VNELWISAPSIYRSALTALAGFGLLSFILLFFVSAPYGRHHRSGWGPTLPARWGWVLMELPSLLCLAAGLLWWGGNGSLEAALLATIFLAHYAYRSLVFPFRLRGGSAKTKPWLTVLLAVAFNSVNGIANAFDLSRMPAVDPLVFGLGIALFLLGVGINHHADQVLLSLRKPGESAYKIPYGGLYRYISAPNYFGEILQWTGFALAAATPAALFFAGFTVCNLLPRARSHHRWYHDNFEGYPAHRKALIPFVW